MGKPQGASVVFVVLPYQGSVHETEKIVRYAWSTLLRRTSPRR